MYIYALKLPLNTFDITSMDVPACIFAPFLLPFSK